MMNRQTIPLADIRTVAELKKLVAANAVATGNSFAFHDLFSRLHEFPEIGDDSGVDHALLDRVAHLLPRAEAAESDGFRAALKLVEKHQLKNDSVPAALLEQTAKEALERGKFAYAEDAYKLLGIKKEMVALYAQTGEQLLRDNKPAQAAIAFFVAASIEQPIGPHFQYLGPELHSGCMAEPQRCVTRLSVQELVDVGIDFLLANETLAQKITTQAIPEQKRHVLASLAVCRDMNLAECVSNLRAAVAALPETDSGKADVYSSVGPTLLGRTTGTGEAWQYFREFCFEHPMGSLCVCLKMVRNARVLVPAVRDGKPLIDLLLPPEFLSR
jgi:hypothetical protein